VRTAGEIDVDTRDHSRRTDWMRRIICDATARKWARALKDRPTLFDQAQICLVDQRGGLKCVTKPLSPEVRGGTTPELAVH
jgi:hypothetical protein